MSSVFVSHSSKDREYVEKNVCTVFRDIGIHHWFAPEHLEGSVKWAEKIQEAMENSDWYVLVLSPDAVASQFVKEELEWAIVHRRDRIFIIRISDCDSDLLHRDLSDIHHFDFAGGIREGQKRFVRDLVRRIDREFDLARDARHQMSATVEVMQDEVDELEDQVDQLTKQIQRFAEFEGRWSSHSWGTPTPFVPRSERKATIIAVANVKGGTGKSTLTANLGAALWNRKPSSRVLLIDLDYQGDLTNLCLREDTIEDLRRGHRLIDHLFHEEHATVENLLNSMRKIGTGNGYIIGAGDELAVTEMQVMVRWLSDQSTMDMRFLLRRLLHDPAVQDRFDYILIDCPPRFHSACINGLAAADFVLVPILLDRISSASAPRMMKWIREMRDHGVCPDLDILGVVGNKKSDRREQLVQREQGIWGGIAAECETSWGQPVHVFATRIPLSGSIQSASQTRKLAALGEMEDIFGALATEVEAQIRCRTGVTA